MNLSFSAYKMGRVVILRQQWAGSIMSKICKVLLLWRFYSSRDSVGECVYSCLPSFHNCQTHSSAVAVSSHCYDKITLRRQLKGKRVDFSLLFKLNGGHCKGNNRSLSSLSHCVCSKEAESGGGGRCLLVLRSLFFIGPEPSP